MPTNTTHEAATQITALPYALTVDPDGEPTLWWKYTPAAGELMVGVFAFSPSHDADDPDQAPFLTVYSDPALGTVWQGQTTIGHRPVATPVDAGTTLWFRVSSIPDATLQVSVVPQPNEDIPDGALLIPDDTPGFPAMVLDPSTGDVLRVIDLPHNESAAVLNDGTFAIYDGTATDLVILIYNPDYTLRASVTLPFYTGLNTTFPVIASDHAAFFYAGATVIGTASPITLYKIDVDGTIVESWANVPNAMSSGAPSRDNAIFYHSGGTIGEAVKRYDLSAGTALSNHSAGVSGMARSHENIRVMADGTLLVGYTRVTSGSDMTRHYAADGSLLHTYTHTTYGTSGVGATESDRIVVTQDDRTDAFWLWLRPADPDTDDILCKFVLVNVADGAVLSSFTTPHFFGGVGSRENGATSTRFGPSFSCPVIPIKGSAADDDDDDDDDDDEDSPCPGCGDGPGGASPGIGYGGTPTAPITTPRIVPPGGLAPSYSPCSTGGAPATASDPTDPQSLTNATSPVVWVQITLPNGTVLRFNGQGAPFTSGNGAVSTPRVTRWGTVSQTLADDYGSFETMRTTVTLADADRVLRGYLSQAATRHIDGSEVVLYIETRANAALGIAPRVLARGVITNWKAA